MEQHTEQTGIIDATQPSQASRSIINDFDKLDANVVRDQIIQDIRMWKGNQTIAPVPTSSDMSDVEEISPSTKGLKASSSCETNASNNNNNATVATSTATSTVTTTAATAATTTAATSTTPATTTHPEIIIIDDSDDDDHHQTQMSSSSSSKPYDNGDVRMANNNEIVNESVFDKQNLPVEPGPSSLKRKSRWDDTKKDKSNPQNPKNTQESDELFQMIELTKSENDNSDQEENSNLNRENWHRRKRKDRRQLFADLSGDERRRKNENSRNGDSQLNEKRILEWTIAQSNVAAEWASTQSSETRTLGWTIDRVGTRRSERIYNRANKADVTKLNLASSDHQADVTKFNLASSDYLANQVEVENPLYSASQPPTIHNNSLYTRARENPKEFTCRGRAILKLALTDILFHAYPKFPPGNITRVLDKSLTSELFDELWKTHRHSVSFSQYLAMYYLDQTTDGIGKVIYFMKCLLHPLAVGSWHQDDFVSYWISQMVFVHMGLVALCNSVLEITNLSRRV
ncbi:1501_t:CDS:2 [Ambispora gerdemannii]|uniref:1501_t:CDS:1 n=1 Tax=Ambispora gerdemannii TaxID=144530 RepID=A0A9N8UXU0_9GLOM|nr:1501_t:CDS:2 [Ambispora gerdemannii]